MANSAIIVAAGEGKRFGTAKQFYLLKKRPLFLYALDAFESNKNINTIVLVVPKQRILSLKAELNKRNYKKVRSIVTGGKRRQDSVYNGLSTLKTESGIVAIHDAVRPFISQSSIKRGILSCHKYKAVIFGIPIFDTVKKVNRGVVVKTVSRKNLYLIQTPQFFDINLLREAFRQVDPSVEYTDEAALLESVGKPVHVLIGDRRNIKVTQKADIKILSSILA